MELTYQSPLMPASYTALSADEMTYIDGGAIQIGSYLIEFHPEALLQSVVNFTVNFGQLMGKAALGTAVGGGKAATVAVGALAGWYGAMQAIQIYNTVKSIFIELKNAYAQTKANIAASQQQDAGITDPIVAAAA